MQHYPDVAIVSSDSIIALRYRGLPQAGQKGAAGVVMERPQAIDTLAIYSDPDSDVIGP